MDTALLSVVWFATLAVAILASEQLVQSLSSISHRLRLASGLVGLLVALGADGPEVTSAIIALVRGSEDIGLGVIVGSNIYNLAALLGLAAILAGGMPSNRRRLFVDGLANLCLTLLLLILLQRSAWRVPVGVLMIIVLGSYVLILAQPHLRTTQRVSDAEGIAASEDPSPERSLSTSLVLTVLSTVVIIGSSYLLVGTSIELGPRLHLSSAVMGTFILPIATSLPNTWAAISLARKRMAPAAISATFNSNSINAALGAGLPGLFMPLHASQAARTIDAGWLMGMTVLAVILLATRHYLARWEGSLLLLAYALFVVVRLAFFT